MRCVFAFSDYHVYFIKVEEEETQCAFILHGRFFPGAAMLSFLYIYCLTIFLRMSPYLLAPYESFSQPSARGIYTHYL